MTEQAYFSLLGKKKASRLNQIIYGVNRKVPKSDLLLSDEVEEMFYTRLIKQAEEHEKKYHAWPCFEMQELETDDPYLDIYRNSIS